MREDRMELIWCRYVIRKNHVKIILNEINSFTDLKKIGIDIICYENDIIKNYEYIFF